MLTPFEKSPGSNTQAIERPCRHAGRAVFPSVRTLGPDHLRRVSTRKIVSPGERASLVVVSGALRRRQSCWSYNLRGWEVAVALSLRNVQGKIVYWDSAPSRSARLTGRSGPRDLRRLWTNTGRRQGGGPLDLETTASFLSVMGDLLLEGFRDYSLDVREAQIDAAALPR